MLFRGDAESRLAPVLDAFLGKRSVPEKVVELQSTEHALAKPQLDTRPIPKPALAPGLSGEFRKPAGRSGLVVGIDLGTTFSVLAHVDGSGRPRSIENAGGELITPSAVFFDEDNVVVGREALKAGITEPEALATLFKRDMGQPGYRRPIRGERIPPAVLSSFVLRSLMANAQQKTQSAVTHAVITVPAYFDQTRRNATLEAGKLAGLDVLDILNEPTAAAIAYAHDLGVLTLDPNQAVSKPWRVIVYDLGGGTFDVSVVEIGPKSFRVLATDGDVQLGGVDWDEALLKIVADKAKRLTGVDPRSDEIALAELRPQVEEAKRSLSTRSKAFVLVQGPAKRERIEITREEFLAATEALVWQTRSTTEIVLRQARLTWKDIDRVLLVGGSTRMPMIVEMLEKLSGQTPDHSLSVDEAVAHGAALYAELVWRQRSAPGSTPRFSITNVNSHGLGIVTRTKDGRKTNYLLIPKNSPLPNTISRTFYTYKDGQRKINIRVLEGNSEDPEACILVGELVIRPLPDNFPKGSPVEITYAYRNDGCIDVRASIAGVSGASVNATFVRENSLDDGQLAAWSRFVEKESTT